jgi:hypothetical protein
VGAPLSPRDQVEDEQVGQHGRGVNTQCDKDGRHYAKPRAVPDDHGTQSPKDRKFHPRKVCPSVARHCLCYRKRLYESLLSFWQVLT